MSFFKKETQRLLTTVDKVVADCKSLGLQLYRHSQEPRTNVWKSRINDIIEDSGIDKYTALANKNNPEEFIEESTMFKVKEVSETVLEIRKYNDILNDPYLVNSFPARFSSSKNIVYIKLRNHVDYSTNTIITVEAMVKEAEYNRKYKKLQIGDRIDLECPIFVNYVYDVNELFAYFNIYAVL